MCWASLKSHCCTNCKFCSNPTQFNEAGSTGSYSTTLPLTQVTVPCVRVRERLWVWEERGSEGGSWGWGLGGGIEARILLIQSALVSSAPQTSFSSAAIWLSVGAKLVLSHTRARGKLLQELVEARTSAGWLSAWQLLYHFNGRQRSRCCGHKSAREHRGRITSCRRCMLAICCSTDSWWLRKRYCQVSGGFGSLDAKCELTPPWSELGTHPHKVADRRLHRGHRHRQIRDGFPVHLSLLVHDDQVGDLLGHRLQDTLDGLGVEHRHRERLLPQPRQKKRRLVAPAEYPPLSPLLSSPLLLSSPRQ